MNKQGKDNTHVLSLDIMLSKIPNHDINIISIYIYIYIYISLPERVSVVLDLGDDPLPWEVRHGNRQQRRPKPYAIQIDSPQPIVVY